MVDRVHVAKHNSTLSSKTHTLQITTVIFNPVATISSPIIQVDDPDLKHNIHV